MRRTHLLSTAAAIEAGGGGSVRSRHPQLVAGLLGLLALVGTLAYTGPPLGSGPAPLAELIASLGGSQSAVSPAQPTEREILDRLAGAQIGFVENKGQAHRSALYVAQGPGYAFAFGREGVRLSLGRQPQGGASQGAFATAAPLSIALGFVGANPRPEVELRGPAGARSDYLVGDRSRWRRGLASRREVVYRELWPGVDMAFRGTGGRLKYEFRVRAGADPRRIQLAYRGAESLSLGAGGALRIATRRGVLKDAAPVSYQRTSAGRVPVKSRFALGKGRGSRYGFATGSYDRSQPLVIDPGIEYSTYLGGAGFDSGLSVAVAGDTAFVTGATESADFPVSANPRQAASGGMRDAFVTRINTSRSGAAALEYSTYLGGGGPDSGLGITLDGSDAYITGLTASPNFPVTAGAVQSTFGGGMADAFVARLDTSVQGAGALEYSTYLGGNSLDLGAAIDITGHEAYITGVAQSTNFPVTVGAFQTVNGGSIDAFVSRVDTDVSGTAGLEYSTYLGGTGQDSGRGIATNGRDAYIGGPTGSANFPTAKAYDPSFNGGPQDAFVSRIDTEHVGAAALEYSTYIGGSGSDDAYGLALQGRDAFITGPTASSDFPVTPTAFQSANRGGQDAYVTRVDTEVLGAPGLKYSTYLGGSGNEDLPPAGTGSAGAIVALGDIAYVTGSTASSNFPVTADGFQRGLAGADDAFLTRLSTRPAGPGRLEYSTYLGGGGSDIGRGLAAEGRVAYVTGTTASSNFRVTPGAFRLTGAGLEDAFLSRIDTEVFRTLTVTKQGDGAGTVTSSPGGISCGSDCSQSYPLGTTVTLTASPASGSAFGGFSGAGCSGQGPCTVTMDVARSVTATFSDAGGKTIRGTAGNDRLVGTPYDDVIICGAGNDVVIARGGDDVIRCGRGNDRIDAGAGRDRVYGEAGNDRVKGASGNDRLSGGRGRDSIAGGTGNDRMKGGSGNDKISGGRGRDRATGDSGDDRINGDDNNDLLIGNRGNDRLFGNRGNDLLIGGPGRDVVRGGPGRNVERQ